MGAWRKTLICNGSGSQHAEPASRRLGAGMGQNEVMDNGIRRLSPRRARGV